MMVSAKWPNGDLNFDTWFSPVGKLSWATGDGMLEALWFAERSTRYSNHEASSTCLCELSEEIRAQLIAYFAGERKSFDLPLNPRGTEFQRTTWHTLRTIPYGQTMSYTEQATLMGRSKAVRAVANANGANPIPIIIPCHRVIASDGSLGGYGPGIPLKQWLLQHEQKHR